MWLSPGAKLRESNLDAIIKKFESKKYYVRAYKLATGDYGLPQLRTRIYIVAAKSELLCSRPETFFSSFESCMGVMKLPVHKLDLWICFISCG